MGMGSISESPASRLRMKTDERIQAPEPVREVMPSAPIAGRAA
jgi:hypothetical protein